MTKRKQDFSAWLCRQQGILPNTAMRYMLSALVPYTEANIALAFKPSRFFNELDKRDRGAYSQAALRKAYYEARRKKLITIGDGGVPVLSDQALRSIRPFRPKKLQGANVMVIFDVPEVDQYKRRWLRLLLRELKFVQVQKSVWMSENECFEVLSAGIIEQRLENSVRIFEARAVEL